MAKVKDKEEGKEAESAKIMFRCKVCGDVKPLDEMVVIERFFPVLLACSACEKEAFR